MFIRPDIISVLELARDIIRNEFNEEYSSDIKYKILMTASAINIATRQLTVDTESIKTVTKELYTITYSDQFNANDPDPSYQKLLENCVMIFAKENTIRALLIQIGC